MRLIIQQDLVQAFETPARALNGIVRLTPRSHAAHHVIHWRLDIDTDSQVRTGEDAFGNIVHSFSVDGPLARLAIRVEGEVETQDVAGVVTGAAERFPPEFYLRETPATRPDDRLRQLAQDSAGGADSGLEKLHALMDLLHGGKERPAEARELAHQFIACARFLGIPARFASGYVLDGTGGAQHAWAEAHVPGIGWIGFDAAFGICPRDGHVRVACGPDFLAAAPWRCSQQNGLPVAPVAQASVRQAAWQGQS